jgi:sec-independent protein translocase protein TatC
MELHLSDLTDNSMEEVERKEPDFFSHLEELRKRLIYILLLAVSLSVLCFLFIDELFRFVVLAPMNSDFMTFRWLCSLGQYLGTESFCGIEPDFFLINIEMAGQFMAHIKISVVCGLVLTFPWILYQLWLFLKPGLYKTEMKKIRRFVFSGSLLFFTGVAFAWLIILPFAIMFLGNYRISPDIANQINMNSYISMIVTTVFMTGLLFELPLLIAVLTSVGIVTPQMLRKYRRHGIVASFILAAIITPTTDIVTLLLVAIPLTLLYEGGIWVSARRSRKDVG